MTAAELPSVPLPAIAHMRYSHTRYREHFVTVVDSSDEGVLIVDPPHSPVRITWASFADAFAGHLLCVSSNTEKPPSIAAGRYAGTAASSIMRWLALADIAILLCWIGHLAVQRRAREAGACGVAAASYLQRILVGATCALALAIGLRQAATALAGRPMLYTDDTVELGALPVGRHQESLALRNDGDAPLDLANVIPGCGCTTANWPDHIAPGETKLLTLDIDVSPGIGHSKITIESSDPASPRIVDLYWVGPREPSLQPASVVAECAPVGRVFQKRLALWYLGYNGMSHHPGVELLTTGDDKNRLRVCAVEGPRLVAADLTGASAALRIYEVVLEVSVESPAAAEHVDVLAFLGVKHGEEQYKLRLPISVDFTAEDAAAVKDQANLVSEP